MTVYDVMEFINWLEGLLPFNENYYVEDCILDLMATLATGKVVIKDDP